MPKNGRRHPLPKVPHLRKYVISGNHFGKVKIISKTIRRSLQAKLWSTVQLKLKGLLNARREGCNKVAVPNLSEAVEIYGRKLNADVNIKPGRQAAFFQIPARTAATSRAI